MKHFNYVDENATDASVFSQFETLVHTEVIGFFSEKTERPSTSYSRERTESFSVLVQGRIDKMTAGPIRDFVRNDSCVFIAGRQCDVRPF